MRRRSAKQVLRENLGALKERKDTSCKQNRPLHKQKGSGPKVSCHPFMSSLIVDLDGPHLISSWKADMRCQSKAQSILKAKDRFGGSTLPNPVRLRCCCSEPMVNKSPQLVSCPQLLSHDMP